MPGDFRWDPAQYGRFDAARMRPALDLLSRVDHPGPGTVYDLGCGRGEAARLMASRWPEAAVTGIDTSPEMLREAAAVESRVRWMQNDVTVWRPNGPADVIFSNAMLHWVTDHDALLVELVAMLAPGGTLAVQMPLSWSQPSHRLMREVLAACPPDGSPVGPESLRRRLAVRPVATPDHYHGLLVGRCVGVDVWVTTYYHALAGPDPVFEWVGGSALRPILAELGESERARFVPEYRRRLAAAYPPAPSGETLLPFARLFIVAHQ
jgi:trans-aconitate 2-methyltransferase